MEIWKFVLAATGTFVSVSGLFFAIFQFWVKKREEKDTAFRASVQKDIEFERKQSMAEINQERTERKEAVERLGKKIDSLENNLMNNIQMRLSSFDGELKGIRATLSKIQDWFISNTPRGGE